MIRRGKLKLVGGTGNNKRKYKQCVVYLCNESIVAFNLEDWDVFRDNDWIEFNKKDGLEYKCFYVSNILSINFSYAESDIKILKNNPDLKPVA